jgi:hypothetical protein
MTHLMDELSVRVNDSSSINIDAEPVVGVESDVISLSHKGSDLHYSYSC